MGLFDRKDKKSFGDIRREREEESGIIETDAPETELLKARLTELFHRAELQITQVNGLYNQYFTGCTYKPPLVERQRLDEFMMTLLMIAKPSAAYRFQYSNVQARYHQNRDRWNRMVQDIESGKVKRKLRPGVKRGS